MVRDCCAARNHLNGKMVEIITTWIFLNKHRLRKRSHMKDKASAVEK